MHIVDNESASSSSVNRSVDRREMILGTVGFLLAFGLPIDARALPTRVASAQTPEAAPVGQLSGRRFNAFLAVGTDNVVTAIVAQTEGGQGISTGMPQVCSPLCGKSDSLCSHKVENVLGRRETARSLHMVVMPAKQKVRAEVEILLPAMARDVRRVRYAE